MTSESGQDLPSSGRYGPNGLPGGALAAYQAHVMEGLGPVLEPRRGHATHEVPVRYPVEVLEPQEGGEDPGLGPEHGDLVEDLGIPSLYDSQDFE